MLLRRVISHVRNQEWTAIGIDFVIVVVGVFIGIQVSNWNDARLREETARSYIERIREDLRGNKDDLSQRLAYFSQVRAHALKALEALDKPQATLDEQFVIDVYQATHMLQRELGRDTYDEILSVGANNAISDVAVRQRLSNFYRSVKAQLRLLDIVPLYREIIRTNYPYSVSREIRSSCGDIVETGEAGEPIIALPKQCAPDLSAEQIAQTIKAVVAIDVRKNLVRRLTNLDAKLWAIQLMLDRIKLLDEHLNDLIGNPKSLRMSASRPESVSQATSAILLQT